VAVPKPPAGSKSEASLSQPRTGRRPGENRTRAAILTAARELFAELGYAGATTRGIARKAGVDPALVHHYFTNKEGVFAAATQETVSTASVLDELPETAGEDLAEQLLRAFLRPWETDETAEAMVALYRTAATSGHAANLLHDAGMTPLLERIAKLIGGRDAKVRAGMVCSQLIGVALLRYVLRLEPLASMSLPRVIRYSAPAVRATLSGEIAPTRRSGATGS
jgi:AcrR family transcriptional regulator